MQGGTDQHMNVANNNRDTNVCMYCLFVAESSIEFVHVWFIIAVVIHNLLTKGAFIWS